MIGRRLGSYEVLAKIGEGGMGEVYRARDLNLRRDVAIKILPGAFSADPDRIARFEREAHAVAALSHPNILAIHDFGSQDGIRYAVTELLVGQTLRDVLRSGPLAPPKATAIATQIARGLEAAHGRGLVHRDLKPDNVFVLDDGHVKILDFGLAKSDGAHTARADTVTAEATGAGAMLGTVGYMAPEQVRGEAVDRRADIFALGCVLYEMLAGRRAFSGDSSIDTLHATLHDDPPDLASLAAVPEPLTRIVARCLEKQPANRFQSSADLRFALDTSGHSDQRPARPPQARRRWWFLPRAGVAVVLVAAAAAAVWYWRDARSSPRPAAAVQHARGIAVLPFENLGGAEQAYFAAGVTEEVTLQIAKIKAIRVLSRAAVSRFKDPATELPAMTRELGIGAVLTGSVRHAGSQVRVGVQLLAAPSGETLWSEQYERAAANIFDVQSDIAVRVARALQASLAPEERERIQRVPTESAEAYELYLQQRRLSTSAPEQNQAGIDLLQKAIAVDPGFALAYATLATRYVYKGNVYGRADYLHGVEAGRQAVRLDPQLARGHHALGFALNRAGRVEEARLSLQRAIELDGNSWGAMIDLSRVELLAGNLDLSAYWAMRAWPLGPNLPDSYYHLTHPLMLLDQPLSERWVAAAAARFKPDDPGGAQRIVQQEAMVKLRRADFAGAVARVRDAVRREPGLYGHRVLLREFATYAATGDAEALVDAGLSAEADGRGIWVGYTPRTLRAYLYSRAGQPGRARPLLEAALEVNRKAIEDGDRGGRTWYENVAIHDMLGNREAALHAWERAVENGFSETKVDAFDPLIAGVKSDPRFVATLDRLRRRIADMRARVDLSVIDEWIARGAPVNATR